MNDKGIKKGEDIWKLIKMVVVLSRRTMGVERHSMNKLLQYLKIPPDTAKNVVTIKGLNKILKSVKKGVYVIVGEAGSGKTALLYTLTKKLFCFLYFRWIISKVYRTLLSI